MSDKPKDRKEDTMPLNPNTPHHPKDLEYDPEVIEAAKHAPGLTSGRPLHELFREIEGNYRKMDRMEADLEELIRRSRPN